MLWNPQLTRRAEGQFPTWACAEAKIVVIVVASVTIAVVDVVVAAFWLLGVSTPDIRNVAQFLVVSQSAINLQWSQNGKCHSNNNEQHVSPMQAFSSTATTITTTESHKSFDCFRRRFSYLRQSVWFASFFHCCCCCRCRCCCCF